MIMNKPFSIKYKEEEYQCNLDDCIRIIIIKCKLFYFRQLRRVGAFFKKDRIIIYLVILFLWILYLFAEYVICIILNKHIRIIELLLQSKDNIFVTVLIAFSLETLNQYREYVANIKRQHYLYVDAMGDFEAPLSCCMGEYAYHFHPMYNTKCYSITERHLKANGFHYSVDDNEEILVAISDRLADVERELKNGSLIVKEEEMLCIQLDSAKKMITRIIIKQDEEAFWGMMFVLYEIQDQLKYLWRLDEEDNKEIIRLIYKNNKAKVEGNFYLRMQLDNFDLEML